MEINPTTELAETTRGRRFAALAFAAVLALGLAACGDDDDDATSDEGTQNTEAPAEDGGGDDGGAGGDGGLEITETEFEDVSAPAGSSLEVVNSSSSSHTVTADDGAFDVEIAAGESGTVDVPAEAGEYAFHCEIHPSMEATLTAE